MSLIPCRVITLEKRSPKRLKLKREKLKYSLVVFFNKNSGLIQWVLKTGKFQIFNICRLHFFKFDQWFEEKNASLRLYAAYIWVMFCIFTLTCMFALLMKPTWITKHIAHVMVLSIALAANALCICWANSSPSCLFQTHNLFIISFKHMQTSGLVFLWVCII